MEGAYFKGDKKKSTAPYGDDEDAGRRAAAPSGAAAGEASSGPGDFCVVDMSDVPPASSPRLNGGNGNGNGNGSTGAGAAGGGSSVFAAERRVGLNMLMRSVTFRAEQKAHPSEFVVTGSRVGVDGTYKRTSLEVEGVPMYSRLGDMAYMAVQDGRWVLWGGSDKKMVRSSEAHDGRAPVEMRSWEELKKRKPNGLLTAAAAEAAREGKEVNGAEGEEDENGEGAADGDEGKGKSRRSYLERLRIKVFEVPELSSIPHSIRAGPWSPVAVFSMVVLGWGSGILGTLSYDGYPFAGKADHHTPYTTGGAVWRLVVGLYCVAIYVMKHYSAADALARLISMTSFTMVCWKVLTLRLILAGLSKWVPGLERPAEVLRFPALCGASVTVGIWWAVIVPLALLVIFKTEEQRKAFGKLQGDFYLIHVHALNLLAAGLDHGGVGGGLRQLNLTDLFLAVVYGVLYLVFYLGFHDPRGYHIYLVLSPRLHTCLGVYLFMFALFYAFWEAWRPLY